MYCKLCGSNEAKLVDQHETWGHGDSGKSYWVQCPGCGTRGPKFTGYDTPTPLTTAKTTWESLHGQPDRS